MPSEVVTGQTGARSTGTRGSMDAPLLRFDGMERAVHWSTASLFILLMLTGAALYAGPISVLVGNRETVRTVHVWCGLLLPVPLVIGVITRRGRRLRTDLRRLNRWAPDERRWFRRRTRAEVELGKFNPGQKLNAAFIAGHVMFAIRDGDALEAMMVNGRVPAAWARRKAPRWYREVRAEQRAEMRAEQRSEMGAELPPEMKAAQPAAATEVPDSKA